MTGLANACCTVLGVTDNTCGAALRTRPSSAERTRHLGVVGYEEKSNPNGAGQSKDQKDPQQRCPFLSVHAPKITPATVVQSEAPVVAMRFFSVQVAADWRQRLIAMA